MILNIRKFLVAAVAVAAQLIELGLISGTALHWTQIGTAVAGTVLVYLVPNKPSV